MVAPLRGEIWRFNPDPTIGREQARPRPGLVISVDEFNAGPRQLLLVLPISRTRRGYIVHVELGPEQSGLPFTSYIMCEQIRAISPLRLLDSRPIGRVPPTTLVSVEERLAALLGFPPRLANASA